MFENEIAQYESLLEQYNGYISSRMSVEDLRQYNEVLFSAHSCAIEGNSFSVNDTRELKEKGLGLIPKGKTLFEAFEILDHFQAYEYLLSRLEAPLSEALLKETHRLLTLHTISYRHAGAEPGEYTTKDMAAGDTVFGEHEVLIKKVPDLLASTQKQIELAVIHPVIIAARFHGFFEYLHPFRDGNGRIGRLFSNFILQKMGHPIIIVPQQDNQGYIDALRAIRIEGTDEYLVSYFFKTAMARMMDEISQKKKQSGPRLFIF